MFGTRRSDVGWLTLRLAVGLTLAAHGFPKLFGGPGRTAPKALARTLGPNYQAAVERSGPQAFARALEGMGVPQPKAAAYMSGIAELGGGLALAAGLATGISATVVVVNMAVAVATAHWKNGFYGQGGFEFPLLLGAGAVAIGVAGPGRLSMDALLEADRRLG